MYIGIDIGGSGIDAGLFRRDGSLAARGRATVAPSMGRDSILREMLASLRGLISGAGARSGDVLGIGVGVPGAFDSGRGEILYTPNLPLSGTNLARELARDFAAPVLLENDANCAALGELRAPGRSAVMNMVFVTVGTGIGGGIIMDRAIYSGTGSAAGEIGHMVIIHGGRQCPCGRRGCWERYASASALTDAAISLASGGSGGAILRLCCGDMAAVTAKTPFDAAKLGDAPSKRLIDEYISYLACGMTNLVNIFQPQLICIGGGVSREPDEWLLAPLRDIMRQEAYSHGGAPAAVEKSYFTDDAGIIGAAALFFK
ncbi:MAG: ROK family protein [Oscillospiraceae bacterium]|jgi:glucokinase|nr:ROK family protein [Oscillospiraceae bacterium]